MFVKVPDHAYDGPFLIVYIDEFTQSAAGSGCLSFFRKVSLTTNSRPYRMLVGSARQQPDAHSGK